jgi:tetratricopeptide (TPR) repeat protein
LSCPIPLLSYLRSIGSPPDTLNQIFFRKPSSNFLIGYGLIAFLWLLVGASGAVAETSLPTERPEDSITYWKSFEVSPEEDPRVKEADEIFKRLLLGWEETRIAPQLHVVRSDKGPWAASLDDGTILLSREAIEVCWKGSKGGPDRLAFVLGHELAHQRADHLWHRRFFRLAGQQPPQVQGRLLGGIGLNQLEVGDLEAKEIQADREGLLMMAMVGFDPQRVVGEGSRFFEEWIESIWGQPCGKGADTGDCEKAKARFERARVQWKETAKAAAVFDLGVQAYVAGKFETARKYFEIYGRAFPRREVHNDIGLTHVGEALVFRKKLLDQGEDLGPGFVYPYILEEGPGLPRVKSRGPEPGTRGGPNLETVRWKKEMERHLSEAVQSFERAGKIDPADRPTYWNLASTHLLMANGALAYGVIAGTYVKRFGQDPAAGMLLALSAYFDNQPEKGLVLLDKSVSEAGLELLPLVKINRAVYLGATGAAEAEKAEWKEIADFGRKQGDEILFRLALQHLGKQLTSESSAASGPLEQIHGYTMGQRITDGQADGPKAVAEQIWMEGERLQIYHLADGSRIVINANNAIVGLWQGEGEAMTVGGIKIGDDASKLRRVYGVPTRKVQTLQGEYRAYEKSRIAFRIVKNKVAGWFLYGPES